MRKLWEENTSLRGELEKLLTEKIILERFLGTPAYYKELKDQAVEKIQI